MKDTDIVSVPPGAINIRSADGSPLQFIACTNFKLTLGDTTLPVEASVLPNLGPDTILLDNSIMGGKDGHAAGTSQ